MLDNLKTDISSRLQKTPTQKSRASLNLPDPIVNKGAEINRIPEITAYTQPRLQDTRHSVENVMRTPIQNQNNIPQYREPQKPKYDFDKLIENRMKQQNQKKNLDKKIIIGLVFGILLFGIAYISGIFTISSQNTDF